MALAVLVMETLFVEIGLKVPAAPCTGYVLSLRDKS